MMSTQVNVLLVVKMWRCWSGKQISSETFQFIWKVNRWMFSWWWDQVTGWQLKKDSGINVSLNIFLLEDKNVFLKIFICFKTKNPKRFRAKKWQFLNLRHQWLQGPQHHLKRWYSLFYQYHRCNQSSCFDLSVDSWMYVLSI